MHDDLSPAEGDAGPDLRSLIEPTRVDAARRLQPDDGWAPALEHLTQLVELGAQLLGVSAGQVSLLVEDQLILAGWGLPAGAVGSRSPLQDTVCTVTALGGAPLVLADAAADPRTQLLPPVTSGRVRGYLGVPLCTVDGTVVGSLCAFGPAPVGWTARDVATMQVLARAVSVQLQLAVVESEHGRERLRWTSALDASQVGSFDWSLGDGTLSWDDRLVEMFGYAGQADFGGTIGDFETRVHPNDRERVGVAMATAIETCGRYDAEFRIVRPDGVQRWVHARGQALPDQFGSATRLLGAAFDTTEVHLGAERLDRVLEAMPAGFFSLDTEWRFVFLNAAAEQLLGQHRSELVGRSIWAAFPNALGSTFEDGYRSAMSTGETRTFQAYYPAPLDAWYEVLAWPTPEGLSVYFSDIDDRIRAAALAEDVSTRLALTARVNAALAGPGALADVLTGLPALLVPLLADGAVLTVVDEAGHAHDVGWAHRDPASELVLADYLAARVRAAPTSSPLGQALTGTAVHSDPDQARAAIPDPETARRLGSIRSLHLPLRGRDRVLGALTLFSAADRPRDLRAEATATDVADRIALAVENGRLVSAQVQLAEALQRSLLTEPPQPDHGQIVVRYVPAAQAARVGGDWYDAFVQPGGTTMLVIGDVAGHDTAAAATMGQLRGLLRGIATYSDAGPREVLRGLDRSMETLLIPGLATAAIARFEQTRDEFDRGITRMVWANAGHPPPLVLNPDGTVVVLADWTGDLLLGVDPEVDRREQTATLDRGATVLMFTDGLIERRDRDLDDGLERLVQAVAELAAQGTTLDELCDGVLARLVDGRPEDDVALVAVRLHRQDQPRPPEAGPNRVPASVPEEA